MMIGRGEGGIAYSNSKAAEYRRTPKPKRHPNARYRGHVLECGSTAPLFSARDWKRVVFQKRPSHSTPMRDPVICWPHAPTHQLSETGTYFVTAGTYFKAHYFRTRDRLDVLHRGLLKVAQDFSWQLEAWAVFSNHYHFVGRSPEDAEESTSLSKMLTVLHRHTAIWLNRLDKTPRRKVWHNFWDTKLTYQKSYLARLNYVHQNPVKHRLVPVANQYQWCSAAWFERIASPAMVRSIYRFKIDALSVKDDFVPVLD
jgi:putative transposase